jgi:hypothetical protein
VRCPSRRVGQPNDKAGDRQRNTVSRKNAPNGGHMVLQADVP